MRGIARIATAAALLCLLGPRPVAGGRRSFLDLLDSSDSSDSWDSSGSSDSSDSLDSSVSSDSSDGTCDSALGSSETVRDRKF